MLLLRCTLYAIWLLIELVDLTKSVANAISAPQIITKPSHLAAGIDS